RVVVQDRAYVPEADERDGKERERVPDAPKRLDLIADPPRFAVRRGSFFGGDRLGRCLHGGALLRTAHRVAKLPHREYHEHRRRNPEKQEWCPPAIED